MPSLYEWLRCVALVAGAVSALGTQLTAATGASATDTESTVAQAGPTHREVEREAEVVVTPDAFEMLSSRVGNLETMRNSTAERINSIETELAQLREESAREGRSLAEALEELRLVLSRLDSESESTANALRARIEAGLGNVRAEREASREALDDQVRGVRREVGDLGARTVAVSNRLTAAEERILEEQGQRRSGDVRNATQVGVAVGLLLIGVVVAWWSGRSRVTNLDSRIQRIRPEMEGRIEEAREQIASGTRQENGDLLRQNLGALEQITAMLESIRSLAGADQAETENHGLPLGVCNELTRIENNLLAMDPAVRGHKQLSACVRRVKENLKVHGYEITELRGRPYDGGMLVEAAFVSEDGLASDDRIITRIIRPEVRFGGMIVQNASVKVSVGL